MICPSCGKEIDGNLKFCSNCGTRLQVHYCSQCGNVLSADKKFCEKCGAPNQFYQAPVAPASSVANGSLVRPVANTEKPTETAKEASRSYTVYSQPTAVPTETTAVPEENMVPPTESTILPEQSSQTEETINNPVPKEEVQASDAKTEESEVKQVSEDETEYEIEEIKGGKGKLFLVLLLVLILGGGGLLLGQRLGWWHIPALSWVGAPGENTSDEESVDAGNFVEGSQGMLKAFGLKGKVKTLTFESVDYDNSFTFAFNPDGNFRETPDYNGGEAVMNAVDIPVYCGLTIDNWIWRSVTFSAINITETTYIFNSYDEYNRPKEASVSLNNDRAETSVAITYSGADSHDNYTSIEIATQGIQPSDFDLPCYVVKTIKVKIEYWPEDATGDDVPTDLTESKAIDIIKKANRKESDALTHEFNRILEMRDAVPVVAIDYPELGGDGSTYFQEGIGTGTLLTDCDNTNIPNIKVRIHDLRIHDSGDTATVVFYFSDIYDGKSEEAYEADFADNEDHLVTAEMKFEAGKWVVDDIGYNVVYAYGVYSTGDSYRNYYNNLDIQIKAIRSGELEKEIREAFYEDPKLNEYLKKLEDFKKRFDIK